MYTIMFVERPEVKGQFVIDFHLTKNNYYYSPAGIIRIARFQNAFSIEKNMGYYGDIYMKQFIRKWKQKTYENIQRRKDRINAIEVMEKKRLIDVDNIVLEFL